MMDNRVELLKSLADETRFNIVLSILEKEKTVSQIVKEVGKAQPTVSLHLKLLQLNNIITSRKQGKFILYSVSNTKIKNILEVLG